MLAFISFCCVEGLCVILRKLIVLLLDAVCHVKLCIIDVLQTAIKHKTMACKV